MGSCLHHVIDIQHLSMGRRRFRMRRKASEEQEQQCWKPLNVGMSKCFHLCQQGFASANSSYWCIRWLNQFHKCESNNCELTKDTDAVLPYLQQRCIFGINSKRSKQDDKTLLVMIQGQLIQQWQSCYRCAASAEDDWRWGSDKRNI